MWLVRVTDKGAKFVNEVKDEDTVRFPYAYDHSRWVKAKRQPKAWRYAGGWAAIGITPDHALASARAGYVTRWAT